MPTDLRAPLVSRRARVAAEIGARGLDALVVTHLPNVRYLTGLSASAATVVLGASRCVLLVDSRYEAAAHALVSGTGDSGIEVIRVDRSDDEALVGLLQSLGARRVGIEAASMTVLRFDRLVAKLGSGPTLVPTERLVESGRVVKDAVEIETLREAARRISEVIAELPGLAVPGPSERDVAGEIEAALRRAGFERPAFETIVASGPNGAFPHARAGARRLQAGDGVILDFGGVYDGYCVDVTRTLLLEGAPSALRRMFDAVAEAQAQAIAAVRPGVAPADIDAAAREVLGRHGLAEAFGHATGHGLGLEVHEDPRVGRAGGAQGVAEVAEGMVFTIEPGVYVPGVGGVRIEDDVLVVGGGCDVLTREPIRATAGQRPGG